MELIELIKQAREVIIFSEGRETPLGEKERAAFDLILNDVFEGGYEMPALGVSLDALVKEATKTGTWIQFVFPRAYTHREMPFEALLTEIKEGFGGLEFMRMNNGKYAGRDYYYSLARGVSADELYRFAAEYVGRK